MKDLHNIALVNTGDKAVINLESKTEAGHQALPALQPNERLPVGGLLYYLERERCGDFDLAYTCEYPAGTNWEVRLLPPLYGPLLTTKRKRIH